MTPLLPADTGVFTHNHASHVTFPLLTPNPAWATSTWAWQAGPQIGKVWIGGAWGQV